MERIEQKGRPDILVAESSIKGCVSVYNGVKIVLVEKQSIPALIEALKKYME